MYLGRAQLELGRRAEAEAAFSRQIEVAPFHESAYAWRARAVIPLGRSADGERDLQKQIEVAPFKATAYELLGRRRLMDKRFAEAVELLSRATTLEAKQADLWIDLGAAQAAAGQAAEALESLDRGVDLEPTDEMRLRAATTYRELGSMAKAGALAATALPWLGRRLEALTPKHLGRESAVLMDRLLTAWRHVGEAALEAGDLGRAERYLEAAWRLGFSARCGWALGTVREKQGRLADALELRHLASTIPHGASDLPQESESVMREARRRLMQASPMAPRSLRRGRGSRAYEPSLSPAPLSPL